MLSIIIANTPDCYASAAVLINFSEINLVNDDHRYG